MPRKQLILHAGQHKTGSSAIQNYLYTSLSDPSFHYLHSDRPNSSLWMLVAFKRETENIPALAHLRDKPELQQEAQANTREELRQAIEASEAENHILSAESLAHFNEGELQDLLDFVRPYFERVSVHQYFRPFKSRMESAFQEKLKDRFSPITEKYVLDYRRAVQVLDSIFGKENVYIHKYDTSSFPKGNVVAHFLQQLGITSELSGNTTANAGLSMEAVKLLYIYRMHFGAPDPGDQERIKRLSELGGPPLRFHRDLYQQLLIPREGCVEWFEQRAGFSISDSSSASGQQGVRGERDLISVSRKTRKWLKPELGKLRFYLQKKPQKLSEIATAVRELANS